MEGVITSEREPKVEQLQQQEGVAEKNVWEEARNMVLIVASLIVTVTYTAGLTPPATIWKEGMKLESKCIFHVPKHTNFFTSSHYCPALAYFIFMSFNTAGFFSSVFLIFFFRHVTYMQVLLQISLSSMMINYVTLSIAMAPNGVTLILIYLVTLVIFLYCIIAYYVSRAYLLKLCQKMTSTRYGQKAGLRRLVDETIFSNAFCCAAGDQGSGRAGGSSHGNIQEPSQRTQRVVLSSSPQNPMINI